MRKLARRTAMKTRIRKAQPPHDPYSSSVVDDSSGWVGPLPVNVVSVLDLTEDVHRSGIRRGMRVLDLECGVGDLSLWIGKLVGPSGLVVGVDESAEDIDTAERRATVAGQCHWTRFVTADPETFTPHGRFDVVVVHHTFSIEREGGTLSRLSSWLQPDGVIIIMTGKPAGSTNNRSLL